MSLCRGLMVMTLRKLLLSCGAISSVLYLIAIDVITPLQHPGYHNFTSQMLSELMAVGAPTRHLLIWLLTPYNLLVFAFAAGVWASAQGRHLVRLTATALVGYGIVSTAGLFFFPMDLRGTVGSQRDARHIAATFVMSIFIVAVMAFGAFAQGKRFRCTCSRPSRSSLCLARSPAFWLDPCRDPRQGWVWRSGSTSTQPCCGWHRWQRR